MPSIFKADKGWLDAALAALLALFAALLVAGMVILSAGNLEVSDNATIQAPAAPAAPAGSPVLPAPRPAPLPAAPAPLRPRNRKERRQGRLPSIVGCPYMAAWWARVGCQMALRRKKAGKAKAKVDKEAKAEAEAKTKVVLDGLPKAIKNPDLILAKARQKQADADSLPVIALSLAFKIAKWVFVAHAIPVMMVASVALTPWWLWMRSRWVARQANEQMALATETQAHLVSETLVDTGLAAKIEKARKAKRPSFLPHILLILSAPFLMGSDAIEGIGLAAAAAPSAMAYIGQRLAQLMRGKDKDDTAMASFAAAGAQAANAASWKVFAVLRFGFAERGGITLDGNAHTGGGEKKGVALSVIEDQAGGAYFPAILKLAERLGVNLTLENAIRYECEDVNDPRLKKAVADSLLAANFIVLCDGFAVHKDIAEPFIKDANERFASVVEVRSYFRSLVTTPAIYPMALDLPVFGGNLALNGWTGNDGGAVHTNRLMTTLQFRLIADLGKWLAKGLTSSAKVVVRVSGKAPELVNYSRDDNMGKAVKAAVERANKAGVDWTEKDALAWVNKAGEAAFQQLPGIGPKRAAAIIAARPSAGWTSWAEFTAIPIVSLPKDIAAYRSLRFYFEHEGKVYALALVLDSGCFKGRDKKKFSGALTLIGHQGMDAHGWAIAVDNPGGTISLGWQVVQLLTPAFVSDLFGTKENPGAARKGLVKAIKRQLSNENPLLQQLLDQYEGDSVADLFAPVKALAIMAGMGKTSLKRISNGLGAKAQSLYVQMMDLGGDYLIVNTPKQGDKYLPCGQVFFGRTPNQGHETIRAPLALSPSFVGGIIDRELEALETGDPSKVEGKEAVKFRDDMKAGLTSDQYKARLLWILTMLPSVIEGVALVDTTLQAKVCGDNDGDRNMISFDPMLVDLAKMVQRQHPDAFPAREQDKKDVLNTFAPAVLSSSETSWLDAFTKWRSGGSSDDMAAIQRFLSAPGNSPGQGNVGGTTQAAAAAVVWHEWGWFPNTTGKKVFGPKNPAARRLMNFLYLCQQIAIDRQKYYYLAPSLLYWHLADLTKGTGQIKKLKAGGGNDPAWQGSHYPIFGAHDKTRADIQKMWDSDPNKVLALDEKIPMMTSPFYEEVNAKTEGMYSNAALYNFTAWQLSAINLGWTHLTYEQMKGLRPLVMDGDWEGIGKFFSVTAEEAKKAWVFPDWIPGWTTMSFMDPTLNTPLVFKMARIKAREVWTETLAEQGLDDTPANTILNSNLQKFLEDEAEGEKVVVADWAMAAAARAVYRSYVQATTDMASNRSQSDKAQSDHNVSGSDQLAALKAALRSPEFEVVASDGNGHAEVTKAVRYWAAALENDNLSHDRRLKMLSGMGAWAIKAVGVLEKASSDATAENVSAAIVELIGENGSNTVKELAAADEDFRGWKESNDKQHNTKDAMARRKRMELALKGWRKLAVSSFIKDRLKNNQPITASELTVIITAAEGEGGEENITAFLLGDFMGAIGEAAKREQAKGFRNTSLVALKALINDLSKSPVDDNFESVSKGVIANAIVDQRQKMLEAYAAAAKQEPAAWYRENQASFEEESASTMRPFAALARLIEHELNLVKTGSDPDGIWDRITASLIGKHQVKQSAGTWEEHEHVISRISYHLPADFMASLNIGLLNAGYDLHLLTNIPNKMKVPKEGEDLPLDPKQHWLLRKGYINISALMVRAAKLSPMELKAWMLAQLECGTGHATTGMAISIAYGQELAEERHSFVESGYCPFWSDSPAVLAVQKKFMGLYLEKVMIGRKLDENDPLVEEANDALNDDTLGNEDREYYSAILAELKSTQLYLPPLFGGRSNWRELIEGKWSEYYGENVIQSPYQLLRKYSFFMTGNGGNLAQPTIPDDVKEFQKNVFGFTVGDSGRRQTMEQRQRTADQTGGSRPHRGALRENLSKKQVTAWSWEGVEYPITGVLQLAIKGVDDPGTLLDHSIKGYTQTSSENAWVGAYSLLRFTPSLLWSISSIMDTGSDFWSINMKSLTKVKVSSLRRVLLEFSRESGRKMIESVEVVSLPNDPTEIFNILAQQELPID